MSRALISLGSPVARTAFQSFGATGHLSEADAAGCRTGRGFMPATTFRAIAKSAGLAGVGNMAVIPVGARHLISKKHLKVLTTELGERRKEHRGEARNLEIIQKRQVPYTRLVQFFLFNLQGSQLTSLVSSGTRFNPVVAIERCHRRGKTDCRQSSERRGEKGGQVRERANEADAAAG